MGRLPVASTAARATHSHIGRPAVLFKTLGVEDFILVPSPAANIKTLQFMKKLSFYFALYGGKTVNSPFSS